MDLWSVLQEKWQPQSLTFQLLIQIWIRDTYHGSVTLLKLNFQPEISQAERIRNQTGEVYIGEIIWNHRN